jgi:DNA invertase Pin-like site-specific DNA recombinase
MARTALYRRESEDRPEEDEQGGRSQRERGVTYQLEDGIELCKRKRWPLPVMEEWPNGDVFTDNNKTASRFAARNKRGEILPSKRREKYKALCKAIEDGKYDRVVMAVEDRTHRQTLELAEFIELCREHNVTPATVGTEYDLSDPDQLTIWYIKVRFAEAEVEKISRRTTRARKYEREQGQRHPGGYRAFGEPGTGPKGNGKRKVPAEQVKRERALILEAAIHVDEGDSLRAIVLDWNTCTPPVLTAKGGRWTTPVLRRMLLAPRVAGLRGHDGEPVMQVKTHNGKPVMDRDGNPIMEPVRLVEMDRGRPVVGEDGKPKHVEPIVPVELWERVRRILTNPERTTGNHGAPGVSTIGGVAKYLLTGMVWCGVCGGRLRGRTHNGRAFYQCEDQHRGGRRCVQRDAARVEGLITGALFHAVEDPAWGRAAARPADDPARPLLEELARDTGLLDRLADKIADELITAEDGRRQRARIEHRMDETRDQLARLDSGRVVAAIPRNLREVWPDLSLDRRRAILGVLIERVVIHPQHRSRVFDPSTIELVRKT